MNIHGKTILFTTLSLVLAMPMTSIAQSVPSGNEHSSTAQPMHRYLIKRTFPAGALDGLNLAAKKKVNATNAKYHVKWIRSYATADKNLTFCVYEAPDEQAIHAAAKANGIPVDHVFAVPVTLMPKSKDVIGH